jgi:hypothetical protein
MSVDDDDQYEENLARHHDEDHRALLAIYIGDAEGRGLAVTRERSGQKSSWNDNLQTPRPNTAYVIDERFIYETDAIGRVVVVKGQLDWWADQSKRGTYRQKRARLSPDDQGGHIVARRFGGAGEGINLVSQLASCNRPGGEWFALEGDWARAQAEGDEITVEIELVYPDDEAGRRPAEIRVQWLPQTIGFAGPLLGAHDYEGEARVVPNSLVVRL